jgi:hypothetical protein
MRRGASPTVNGNSAAKPRSYHRARLSASRPACRRPEHPSRSVLTIAIPIPIEPESQPAELKRTPEQAMTRPRSDARRIRQQLPTPGRDQTAIIQPSATRPSWRVRLPDEGGDPRRPTERVASGTSAVRELDLLRESSNPAGRSGASGSVSGSGAVSGSSSGSVSGSSGSRSSSSRSGSNTSLLTSPPPWSWLSRAATRSALISNTVASAIRALTPNRGDGGCDVRCRFGSRC